MNDYSPKDSLDNALRYWWVIILMTILGGLVGWFVHQLRPPLYEAKATFFISIDFSQTGELTQFEEDHAVSVLTWIVYYDEVIDEVIDTAEAQGIQTNRQQLEMASTLERKQARWTLYYRDKDPQTASALANIWAEVAMDFLQQAHQHALQIQALDGYLNFLAICLQGPAEGEQYPESCNDLDPAAIPEEIQETSIRLEQELAASHAVFPALIFDVSSKALPPAEPVQYGRNRLVLAGGLIGFILGIFLVNTSLPQRLQAVLRRG